MLYRPLRRSFPYLFSSTEEELTSFLSTWFPGSSPTDLRKLLKLYPSDPAAGSPFDTGNENVFSPQFKRIAALQGDFLFHGPRRLLLDAVSAKRTVYNYRMSFDFVFGDSVSRTLKGNLSERAR